jgi:hypothetical protein
MGRSERHQAAKLPRCLLMALAAGVDKVFVYREKGSTPAQHAGAGLIRNDVTLRPSFLTTSILIRQLAGFDGKAVRLTSPDSHVWAYLWRQEDRALVAAWRTGKPGVNPLDLGIVNCVDSFGGKTTQVNSRDLQLSEFPVYLEVDPHYPGLP